MKRIVNIILTLCIVASMLAGVSINAFAAETISEVVIEGIPEEIEAGQAWSEIEFSVSEDANYRVEREWAVFDPELEQYTGVDSATVGEFNQYMLSIYLYPRDGFVFPDAYSLDWDLGEKVVEDWDVWEDEAYFSFVYYVGFEVITEVEITSIEAPVVGEMPSLDGIVLPEGVPYYINESASKWVLNDNDSWEAITGAFEKGHNYELDLYLIPEYGYIFDEDAENIFPVVENYRQQDPDFVNYEFEFTTKELITEVDISGIPEMAVGNEFSWDTVVLSDNVVLSEDSALFKDGEDDAFEGTLVAGHYMLDIYLVPAEGYAFAPDIEITINGEAVSAYWHDSISLSSLNVYRDYQIDLPEIEEVHFDNVPGAELGGAAVIGGITIPEDANYVIEYVQWCDKTSEACDITTFEAGHKYTFNIRVIPLPGYQFAGAVDVYVDGEYIGDEWTDIEYYDYIVEYSFLEKIDTVQVSGSTYAVIGEEPVIEDIQTPSDANYQVSYVEWYNVTDETYDIEKFEDRKKYEVYIEISPDEGCEFAEDAIVILNGEEYDVFYNDGDYIEVYVETSFLEKIDTVDLPAFPEVEAGDEVGTVVPDLGEEEDPYTVVGVWVESESGENVEGALEEGKLYTFAYVIMPKEGYEFSDDVTILVEGEETSAFNMSLAEMLIVLKAYGIGVEALDKIEITIPEPAEGEEPASIEDVVIPEDAKYSLVELEWDVSDDDNLYTSEDMEGVFETGKYYFISMTFETAEGYFISEETEIYINGEKSSDAMIYLDNVICGLGELKEEAEPVEPTDPVEPSEPTEPAVPNPGTGDNAVVICAAIVMLVAAALVILRRKEER